MSYPINYPTPQGANVQIFQAPVRADTAAWTTEWVKPQGASFVFFTLIGSGGGTDISATTNDGGGSGAVTNFMCPAFLIPDILQVRVGKGGLAGNNGTDTEIRYQQKAGTSYLLLEAGGGAAGQNTPDNGGNSMSANYFTIMGFLNTTRGQSGSGVTIPPSTETFLSSGNTASTITTANYGYQSGVAGFFQTQPIIVGTGGNRAGGNNSGGLGCGGGGTSGGSLGQGGNGLVVIITW
jgi:hypothetical protein